MVYCDDDIALFVTCVDIAVRFDHVFQRITSVNDRSYLSRFSEFFEVRHIFGLR